MDFLSDLELDVLISRIYPTIHGKYINNVYSLDELRYSFTVKDYEYALNLHLKIGLWLSDKYIKERWEGEFIRNLRDFLEGSRLEGAEVPPGQRIIALHFSTGTLYVELFGSSNLVCADRYGIIKCALREEEFRDRKVKAGEVYALPKLRGKPISELPEPPYDEKVPVSKHLGFYLATSKKIIDEILYRAKVQQDKSANLLSEEEKEAIKRSLKDLVEECKSSERMYQYQDGTYSLVKLLSKGEPIATYSVPLEVKDAFDPFLFRVEEASDDEKKKALAQSYLEKAKTLREIAQKIMSSQEDEFKSYIKEKGGSFEKGILKIEGETVRGDSLPALASKIYERAKEFEAGAKKVLRSRTKEREKKVNVVSVKKREWYEKYRWFFTSEGFLAVGGRDSSSNEAILRKYVKPDDYVFHTELPGSPFFVVSGKAGETSLKEVATATASFSRAWKIGLTSADVYYVRGEQISFSAPSGEYMGKGSAMILGKRNYVKGLQLKLGVGLAEISGELKAYCAPLSSASKMCDWFLEIEPGRLSQAEAAKKIQKKLSELYGRVTPLEEIQRALPAGNTEIVGIRKRGDIPYI
ncbi:MAG: NFACT RNA binding domain-containing protein [Nitrososphaeria archaeon]|nr:NFACT RNA binding domain-containing protein [Conexivisphaerales archaeon]